MQPIDPRNHHGEAWPSDDAMQAAEAQDHAPLVLSDHTRCRSHVQHARGTRQGQRCEDFLDHREPPFACTSTAQMPALPVIYSILFALYL